FDHRDLDVAEGIVLFDQAGEMKRTTQISRTRTYKDNIKLQSFTFHVHRLHRLLRLFQSALSVYSVDMPNHLINETSPYLLQHAHNPVNWYPWGEEAFEKARSENKPILLSVGYSACHWCHVMAHESFEDEQ